MKQENENIPEIERLELKDFIVDLEEQKRLEAMVEDEVLKAGLTHIYPNMCKYTLNVHQNLSLPEKQ